MLDNFEKISILGVRVDILSLDELLIYVNKTIYDQKKAVIANVNVHAINLAQESKWFKDFLNHSQVVFCDGFGVKWTARFLYKKVIDRFTPPDWFDRLAQVCVTNGFSIFFLGTHEHIINKAALIMRETYPGIKIQGVHHGFFDKSINSSENLEIIIKINQLKPDILVVGFGMPAQEKWISENFDRLNVHLVFPVGAYFDYLTGAVVRAPHWMTDNGLEWFGRLFVEPRRLWKRYLIGNVFFLWKIILHYGFRIPLEKNNQDPK
jgi:N-acetylglucosaminyldiphosphoundecaprenol N-acetyl-beta-D-mannosaminyltransferase